MNTHGMIDADAVLKRYIFARCIDFAWRGIDVKFEQQLCLHGIHKWWGGKCERCGAINNEETAKSG